ncbi:unnamed protein product [Vitrella brassicaformis CCMP3155]|uniref:Uncharacterized protein n=1 Tax=Vitrella brassicaformis (strain CCMP3155) TaxID=1169540 RepID=A0A0G4F0C2_VITBC|nr:unnamed protein product [Vitrella brassicaformis CCMP3155]|eukprot:CEM04665.1 unnamed protein product [Vitrella brassicaformis CCMP3155]
MFGDPYRDREDTNTRFFRNVQCILQFLRDNGLEASLTSVASETGVEYIDGYLPGGALDCALDLYEDYRVKQVAHSSDGADPSDLQVVLPDHTGHICRSQLLTVDPPHPKNVLTIRFLPPSPSLSQHQTFIATGAADSVLRIIRLKLDDSSGASEVVAAYEGMRSPILTIDFDKSSGGGLLLLLGGMAGNVQLVRWEEGRAMELLHEYQHHATGKPVLCARFSPDGRYIVTASKDRTLALLERANDAEAESSGGGRFVQRAAFTFTGEVLAIEWVGVDECVASVRGSYELHYFSASQRKETMRTTLNAMRDDVVSFAVLDLKASADGTKLLACTDKSRLILFATKSSMQLGNYYGFECDDYSLPVCAFSLDGKSVYATSTGAHSTKTKLQAPEVVCWDIATQRLVHRLRGHKATIRTLARHPTRELIATGGFDKQVILYS